MVATGISQEQKESEIKLKGNCIYFPEHYTKHKKKRLDKVVTPLPSGVTRSKSGQVRFQGF